MNRDLVTGFTLIELLVTLAVLAIVLAIAAPNFTGLFAANRLVSETNNLASALAIARSEAIKRGSVVSVCKTLNPDAAAPTCNNAAAWASGLIVFVDGGVRGTVDGGDARLKIHQPGGVVGLVITPSASFDNLVSFASSGSAVANNTIRDVPTSGDFTICLGGRSRVIDIALSGRLNTTPGVC